MTRLIPVQSPGPAKARQVPRAPLPATGVTSYVVASAPHQRALPLLHRSYWLMRQTKTLPPTSVVPNTTGLCRLSPVPAGSWPFPTLSLQSLHGCLDPCPAAFLWCTCSLLPKGQRPHLRTEKFGTLNIPVMQLQQGNLFRSCSHSIMFRLPYSIDPQVAPTAEALSLQGGQAVYTTQWTCGYPQELWYRYIPKSGN